VSRKPNTEKLTQRRKGAKKGKAGTADEPSSGFRERAAMVEAQDKIRVNPCKSAVRFFAFFVFSCGYSRTYSYED
jgi:hypothetical protein